MMSVGITATTAEGGVASATSGPEGPRKPPMVQMATNAISRKC
jgi:hypothetical protein